MSDQTIYEACAADFDATNSSQLPGLLQCLSSSLDAVSYYCLACPHVLLLDFSFNVLIHILFNILFFYRAPRRRRRILLME